MLTLREIKDHAATQARETGGSCSWGALELIMS